MPKRATKRPALIAEARQLRAKGLSYQAIATKLVISAATIKKWIGIRDPYGSFGRGIVLSATPKRVDVGVAKDLLDPLLNRFSKERVAQVTGLSSTTLTRIDHLQVRRVDHSTIRALSSMNPAPRTPPPEN